MNRRSLLALTATGLAVPSLLRAQSWPDRPIRLIVPWPPGGSTDTIARLFQPKLSEALGKQVIIENRGGASGSIGAIEAARAAPDGYTWMFAYDNEATNQTLMRLPYKTLEAFSPVSLVATGPLALVAHSSTPYRTFQDVVAAAKAAPDTVGFASSGVGGLAHVSTTLLQQQGGFGLVHVPYRGGGPAVQDAVSGQVPLFMSNVVIISQHIRAGTLRPLGRDHRDREPARAGRGALRAAGLPRLRRADLVGLPRPGRHARADPAPDARGPGQGTLRSRGAGADRGAGVRREGDRAGGVQPLPRCRDRPLGQGDPRQQHPRRQLSRPAAAAPGTGKFHMAPRRPCPVPGGQGRMSGL